MRPVFIEATGSGGAKVWVNLNHVLIISPVSPTVTKLVTTTGDYVLGESFESVRAKVGF